MADRSRPALRRSLQAGAVYDVVLGIVILLPGREIMALLGSPLPAHALFYFSLAALPLLLLPALYLSAARAADPDPFRGAVLWARMGGGLLVILLVLVFRPDPGWLFLLLGIVDLAFAALHAALWRR